MQEDWLTKEPQWAHMSCIGVNNCFVLSKVGLDRSGSSLLCLHGSCHTTRLHGISEDVVVVRVKS